MPAAKKTASVRRSSKKSVSKKTASKTTAPTKKPAKKLTPKKKETFEKNEPTSLPFSNKLATLNPFRFPIPVQVLMQNAARYGGLAFVVLGGIFTMYHLPVVQMNDWQQSAQLINSNDAITDPSTDTTVLETNDNSITSDGTTNTEPTVQLNVNGGDILSGEVDVTVRVDGAQEVGVQMVNVDSGSHVRLGNAVKVSDTDWKFRFTSENYPNGKYKLYVAIVTAYGSYQKFDSQYRQISNELPDSIVLETEADTTTTEAISTDATENDTTTEDSANDTTTEESGTVEGAAEPSVDRFRLDSASIFSNDKIVIVETTDGNRIDTLTVWLIAKDGKQYELKAEQETEDTWAVLLETAHYPNGEYRLKAEAVYAAGTDTKRSRGFIIGNTTESVATPDDATGMTDSDETTTTETVKSDDELTYEEQVEFLDEPIDTSAIDGRTIAGVKELAFVAPRATEIEIYLQSEASTQQRFIGRARKGKDDSWVVTIDSKNYPNGTYRLLLKVRTAIGWKERESQIFTINNPVVTTVTTAAEDTILTNLASAMQVEDQVYQEEMFDGFESVVSTVAVEDTEVDPIVREAESRFREQADEYFKRLTVAIRNGDQTAADQIQSELVALRDVVVAELEGGDSERLLRIQERIDRRVERTKELNEKVERVIRDRVTDDVFTDSDNDGVSDYDERNLFNTDPFSADSDQDGFVDGVEILQGYNPNDPTPEAVVVFESPKEEGVVREDVFKVTSVTTVADDENTTLQLGGEPADTRPPKALLTGKALPNSFVTIYIFSTPIVITVKSDEAGNWSYVFDKELENGEHEVYVGVTDNAGRVVAKSDPFTFVKTAEAFTPVAASAGPAIAAGSDNSFWNERMILLVLSISVVAIGLLLILLGMFLNRRDEETSLLANA